MSLLIGLSREQREAVERVDGPILVLAGAGSGKTKTLTTRIAYMIKEKAIPDSSILAITFTNKAAKEMKERVEKLIGLNQVFISTFHSFGTRVLRRYISHLGLSPNFNIYDVDDQKRIVSRLLKDEFSYLQLTPSKSIDKISKMKEAGLSESFDSEMESILARLCVRYQEELKKNNALDFADILVFTNKLLSNPHVLEEMQERYRYVMVDEYQDTNGVQYEIVSKLANKHRNIFVVGDEDQGIYSFRGANISNILNFEKDYDDARIFKLEQNYRSSGNILSAANGVIKNNKTSKGKRLWTERDGGEPIFLHEAEDSRKEAKYLSDKIKRLVSENGNKYGDVAVLYRNNFQSREIEEELMRASIPYKIYGGIQFYQRKEIKDILAYLFLINNPRDRISFFRIVNLPQRGIGEITLDKLARLSDENDISMLDAITEAKALQSFSSNIKTALVSFKDSVDEFAKLASEGDVARLIQAIFEETGYYKSLKENSEEDRIENVRELISLAKEGGYASLPDFLERVALASSIDNMKDEEDHVKLMTIHSSKGLEFPIVFLTGAEEELFPHSNSVFSGDIEEERRLFYVCITRAKQMFSVSYAKTRTVYNSRSYFRERSRFIDEIPGDLLSVEVFKDNSRKSSEVLFKAIEDMKKRKAEAKRVVEDNNRAQLANLKRIIGLSLGDRVAHKIFGLGKVISLSLDKVVILFEGEGEKKFLSSTVSKFVTKI